MAKRNQMVTMPKSGGVLGKVIGAAILLGLLVLVVKHPSDAADWTKALGDWVGGAIDGIAAFFRQVAA